MLNTVGRMLELSVAAHDIAPMRQERIDALSALPVGPRKMVSQTINDFTNAHIEQAKGALNLIARRKGFHYLGSGCHFSTYRSLGGNRVTKVNRRSAYLNPTEQHHMRDAIDFEYRILSQYLGNMALDQETVIDEHILGKYDTVQVRQPFVPFDTADSPFQTNSTEIDIEQLERVLKAHPGVDGALKEFINRSVQMHAKDGFLPDTLGHNNVVAAPDGNVAVLDSGIVGANHLRAQELILQQFDSLSLGLRIAA